MSLQQVVVWNERGEYMVCRVIVEVAHYKYYENILRHTIKARFDVRALFFMIPWLNWQKIFKSSSFEFAEVVPILSKAFREKEYPYIVISSFDCLLPVHDLISHFFDLFFWSESVNKNCL